MLQVFHLDIAKVDRDVAHVAMAIHVCFKCIFQMFNLFFQTFVASVSSGCCICFICMLQVFYWMLDMFVRVFKYFASVSDACCKCFSYFIYMLQVFHLDVSKIYQNVAHIAI
jgi:hypothetical protein